MAKKREPHTPRTWQCAVCKHTINEADLPYTEVLCSRTGACRRKNSHMEVVTH